MNKVIIIVIAIVAFWLLTKDRRDTQNIKEGYSGRSEQMQYLNVPSFEPYSIRFNLAYYDPYRYEDTYIPRYDWLFPNNYSIYNYVY